MRALPGRVLAALFFCLLEQGCASLPRDEFSALDQAGAAVPGFDDARTWADGSPKTISAFLRRPDAPGRIREVNVLALSGGGAGGAFAAGLLGGWTSKGDRPRFDVVTGVSTGALIAPFAFLGSAEDETLRTLYTGQTTSGLGSLSLSGIVAGSGLVDPAPLKALIARYATPNLLAAVAAEDALGRRLLVVTTNLDAQRPVLWNMGAIARRGGTEALDLFRAVLLASASVPAVYPPVMITAQGGPRPFREMHVDGGTSLQIFADPDLIVAGQGSAAADRRRHTHLWLVVNNTLPPEFAVTTSSIVPVAARAFATLMKSQTRALVDATAEAAKRTGVDFHVSYIDRAIPYDPRTAFDPAYMDAVFAIGDREGRDGSAWHRSLENAAVWASR